jgi:RimJ/RimL family protein N-acetyltransferase
MYSVSLRPAKMSDARNLLKWKNDPDMRRFSIVSNDKIKMVDHLEWLKEHIDDIYIIMYKGKDVGDVRFEGIEVAIKLDKKYRGRGIGTMTLDKVVGRPLAKVVDGNVSSMRLFIKCGFNVVSHHIENNIGYYMLERK